MATVDPTIPLPPAGQKPFDELAYLHDAYSALWELTLSHYGDSSPTATILQHLNAKLDAFLSKLGPDLIS